MKNLKHYIRLVEAGEPTNPSRRGFLRTLGAAGAAAAMPGTALKALATPAAAVAPAQAAAAAAAASQSTLLNGLWAAAVNYMADKEPDPTSDWDYDADDEDFIPAWDDEIADAGPQGADGMMPWGDDYGMLTTPKGRKYLYTGIAGESGIIAYEEDGERTVLELAWDGSARDYGEALGTTESGEDVDLYLDFSDKYGNVANNIGELVDYIIDGGAASPGPQAPEKSVDTTPVDLARLAGLALEPADRQHVIASRAAVQAAREAEAKNAAIDLDDDNDGVPDVVTMSSDMANVSIGNGIDGVGNLTFAFNAGYAVDGTGGSCPRCTS